MKVRATRGDRPNALDLEFVPESAWDAFVAQATERGDQIVDILEWDGPIPVRALVERHGARVECVRGDGGTWRDVAN